MKILSLSSSPRLQYFIDAFWIVSIRRKVIVRKKTYLSIHPAVKILHKTEWLRCCNPTALSNFSASIHTAPAIPAFHLMLSVQFVIILLLQLLYYCSCLLTCRQREKSGAGRKRKKKIAKENLCRCKISQRIFETYIHSYLYGVCRYIPKIRHR